MANAEELGVVIGGSYRAPVEWADVGVRTLGGTTCSWYVEGTGPGIRASALPYEVVPADVREHYAQPVCEAVYADGSGCRVAVADEATWVLVTIDEQFWGGEGELQEDVVEAKAREQLALVTPLFERSLARAGNPAPAARTTDGWAPTTCEQLEARVPIASVIGGEAGEGYPSEFATDVPEQIAETLGTRLDCKWHAFVGEEMTAVLVTAYPGGGWDFPDASAKASEPRDLSPVAVDGATSAVAGIGGLRENASALMATDGVNLLWQIEAPDAPAAAAAIIAALAAGG